MFWNISTIYFSFLTCKTLRATRATVTLFLSNFLQKSFCDGKFIPFQLYLFITGLIFVILCRPFLISSWFYTTITTHWKHLLLFFIDGIYCCFFVFYPIRRIYIWSSTIQIHFIKFIMQWMNIIEDKLTMFHRFQFILLSISKYIKKFFITSSTSLLNMISVLSLF